VQTSINGSCISAVFGGAEAGGFVSIIGGTDLQVDHQHWPINLRGVFKIGCMSECMTAIKGIWTLIGATPISAD